MPKRVLITGVGGFVASHAMAHFMASTDWEIVGTDSFRHRGKTDRLREMFKKHPEWRDRFVCFTHDLSAPFSKQLISNIGPVDYIVNYASESHVDRSIEDPAGFILNNVQLMLNVLEYARQVKPKKFIQISTDEVNGPSIDGVDHAEGAPHRPSNPYSASKAAQEDICFSYWRTFNVPIVLTNTMNMVGEAQDYEKFVPKVIKQIHDGVPVTIHASSSGEIGSRYYLHCRNQADAVLFIINNTQVKTYGDSTDFERFNIVGDLELTNLELAQMIAKYAGKELQYELVDFHSSRPGHDLRYGLDGSKLAEAGWKAPIELEEGIKNIVEWYKENPEWLL